MSLFRSSFKYGSVFLRSRVTKTFQRLFSSDKHLGKLELNRKRHVEAEAVLLLRDVLPDRPQRQLPQVLHRKLDEDTDGSVSWGQRLALLEAEVRGRRQAALEEEQIKLKPFCIREHAMLEPELNCRSSTIIKVLRQKKRTKSSWHVKSYQPFAKTARESKKSLWTIW